jgi:hypothetical protein
VGTVRLRLLLVAILSACPAPAPSPDAGAPATDGAWRASLYPEDWTPGFTDDAGRFLHDFSYAGYAAGLAEPPSPPPTVRLTPGPGDMTALVQAHLDDGGVVLLGEGDWRFDGTLDLRHSHTVLRGEGPERTRLFFTRSVGLSYAEHVRVGASPVLDGEWALLADAEARVLTVRVADAGTLAAGDDVALGQVITPAFVADHGMTGTWRAFNDTWQPFLWRRVVSVGGDEVTLDAPVRNTLRVRDGASLRKVTNLVREVGIEHLALTNAVEPGAAWSETQVAAVTLAGVTDGWVRGVRSFSLDGGAHLQSGGVRVHQSSRVTVVNTHLGRAQHRGSGGNGYLFEVRQSSDVLFRDDLGEDGRHNFIQNWGFGTTGCVWLRVESRGGFAEVTPGSTTGGIGYSEFHHSLATANLIDSSRFDDGFSIINRRQESTGAGHTGTENAFWNVSGDGLLRSMQFGHGYVLGTEGLAVALDEVFIAEGTRPLDLAEGVDAGARLQPRSLYEDQLRRRRER